MRGLLLAAALVLALPATAHGTFTAAINGTAVTMTGSASPETVTIGRDGAFLAHGRDTAGDPGFDSDRDWDTSAPGEQAVLLDNTRTVVVDAAGGDDRLANETGGLVSLTLRGGDGADRLTGSGFTETLEGGAGDDLVVGGGSTDVLRGGAGDDVFDYFNGDGGDTIDGDAGSGDVLRVRTAGSDEVVEAVLEGGRTLIRRVAPGPFTLSTATVDRFELLLGEGNDQLDVRAGVGGVLADGGGGEDRLAGGDGADVLLGGAGGDTIAGGAGTDLVEGGDGNDAVAARDDRGDGIACGEGTDSVVADRADTLDACENADVPPAAGGTQTIVREVLPAPAPKLTIGAPRLVRGRLRVPLTCAAAACAGRLEARTARAFSVRGVRSPLVLVGASYRLAAGGRATVVLRLPSRARRLAVRRRLALRVVAQTTGGSTATRAVTVRP